MIFICRGIALDGIVHEGLCQTSKYTHLWILRLTFGKKQKYFWICQKYIEISVSNPPIEKKTFPKTENIFFSKSRQKAENLKLGPLK